MPEFSAGEHQGKQDTDVDKGRIPRLPLAVISRSLRRHFDVCDCGIS